MPVVFEIFSTKHQGDVLKMMASFYRIDGYDFDLESTQKNLNEFSSNENLGRLYLIRKDGQNIGYIVLTFGYSFEYNGRDAFIDELYIEEGYRGQGIGDMTMDFIASESKKLGINAVHLEVEKHNQNARTLYSKKGYSFNDRILLTKKL